MKDICNRKLTEDVRIRVLTLAIVYVFRIKALFRCLKLLIQK